MDLTLHPFDLATSKVLALVGRVEPRDFIDTLTCNESVQPFGYLAWAACAKDPGFSPAAILEEAARAMLAAARDIVGVLPADEIGRAVLAAGGGLFRGDIIALRAAITDGEVIFH
jgi:hypothetical protein